MTTATLPDSKTEVTSTGTRTFERWGIAVYLVAVGALVAGILVKLGGTFVYVLDDPAIHLSMADTLVHHRTWGVSPGSFESASSSPLWTLLMAAGSLVAPTGETWLPLVFNLLASVAVVVILGRHQAVLMPGRRQPVDLAAVAVLVVLGLFLPGLALVGMEHTLHIALVLAAVIGLSRQLDGRADRGGWSHWWPYALLALATLVRFETAFVVAGLMVGVALEDRPTWSHLRARWRQIGALGLTAVVPIVGFSLWNRAMGGGWLPNSVLSKGQGVGSRNALSDGTGPVDIATRLTRDALLTALFGLALAYLVVTWGRWGRYRLVAVTLLTATVAHAAFADIGWYERYQAYLIALGLYLALGIIGELPEQVRRRALVVLVVVAVVFTVPKAMLLVRAPRAADDIYRHQYQAGRFLGRYYADEPVATDQLGYISLLHPGPITDLGGLGDYDVLRDTPNLARDLAPLWERLAAERGFDVVAIYDRASVGTPSSWVMAGELVLEGEAFTGVTERLQFWATRPDELGPLQAHLAEFEAELPAGVLLELNGWAEMQAADQQDPVEPVDSGQ